MNLSFSDPEYLLLGLLLIPAYLYQRRHPVDLSTLRRRFVVGLRYTALLALLLAVAGLRRDVPSDQLTVIFLVDRSLSMGSGAKSWAEDYIREATSELEKNERFGVLTFGRDTMIELPAGRHSRVQELTTHVDRGASDLSQALRFAVATFPSDSQRRLVILSDGNDTGQGALEEIQVARSMGIEICALSPEAPRKREVLLDQLELPHRPRIREPFDVRLVVASTHSTDTRLVLKRNGVVIANEKLELEPGNNVYFFPQRLTEEGFFQYTATLEAEQDGNAANNRAQSVTLVAGPPKVLYLHENGRSPGPLPDLFRQAGTRVDVLTPGQLPLSLAAWQDYQVVFLDNVSAFSLSNRHQKWLTALVRELGTGLAILGGEDSYGVGGYSLSPLADVLPVELDIRKKRKAALVGLVLVIDKSGSMGTGAGSPMALAREGAIASATLLTEYDQLGVLGFDSAAKWVVNLAPLQNKEKAMKRIASLRAGGGTDLFPAFKQGLGALQTVQVPLRHLIVLSDGMVAPADFKTLTTQAKAQKITVSTVAVGEGADIKFLKELADMGGGRAYYTASGRTLPKIFTRDTVIASRAAFSEKPFAARKLTEHQILSQLDLASAPALGGYNLASQKAAPAQTLLTGPKEDPLLAIGRAGLGKTLAWTSDNGTRWSRDWAHWGGYQRTMLQGLRYLTPEAETEELQTELTVEPGGQIRLRAQSLTPRIGRLKGKVIAPDGTIQELETLQTGSKSFESTFSPDQPGSWLVHLVDQSSGASVTRSWTVPYSPEHRRLGPDTERLKTLVNAGGGQYPLKAGEAFLPTRTVTTVAEPWRRPLLLLALLFLPLEVAVRRVFLPRKKPRPRSETPAEDSRPMNRLLDVKRSRREKEDARPRRAVPLQPLDEGRAGLTGGAASPGAGAPAGGAGASAGAGGATAGTGGATAGAGGATAGAGGATAGAGGATAGAGGASAGGAPSGEATESPLARLRRAKERARRETESND